MPMVSYAQNAEDVLLRRAFPDIESGFYIDVGANDPVHHSVTKHFYDRGWSGVNVEPEARVYARLAAERARDVNLNVGISDRRGTLTFYDSPEADGWATFDPAHAEAIRARGLACVERSVPVTTLADLCERHARGAIDFLKVDAESHEREVLAGADFRRWRPRVVLIEATQPERWEPILLRSDYHYATFDGLNRYYVRAEDRHLVPALDRPVSVLDDYVPYHYLRIIEDLQGRCERFGDLGPASLEFARRVQGVARRFPRLSATVKRMLRRAG